jgi:type IV secretory pathway VirB3-like protein
MFMGVPLTIGAILLVLAGLIVVLFKNPLYLAVMLPLWFAARELVARFARLTKAFSGPSSPFGNIQPRRGRGC